MSVGATLVASFLVTLVRPETWALALATFLLRGGVVLVVAPIVVIPSAVGLANVVAPVLTSLVFGGLTHGWVIALAVAAVAAVAGGIVGGLFAATAEAESIVLVAADEDVTPATSAIRTVGPTRPRRGAARRILALRLIAHLPTLLALSWGAYRVVAVVYRELTLPSDVVTPLVLRVLHGTPEAVAVIVAAWSLGEVIGGLGARRIVMLGEGVPRAFVGALGSLLRRPMRSAVLALVPGLALIAVVAPSVLATSVAWHAVQTAFAIGESLAAGLALVVLLVGLWGGGLLLLAVVSAWRAAVWTVDAAGTFGAVETVRQGDWNATADSGTLTDLRPRGVGPDRGDR